jgi:hypothetical protein
MHCLNTSEGGIWYFPLSSGLTNVFSANCFMIHLDVLKSNTIQLPETMSTRNECQLHVTNRRLRVQFNLFPYFFF